MLPRAIAVLFTAMISASLVAAAEPAVAPREKDQFALIDVFVAGQDGYPVYRIPSALVTAKGTVLALTEGRQARRDIAENNIVLKRSADGGRTWGPLIVVARDGKNSLNNPQAVVVRETGRVLLMYQSYPYGFDERSVVPGLSGRGVCRSLLVHSDDDGRTWSKPRDLTAAVKRPTKVTSVASGPGVGIQLRRGEHRGRLLMPFNQGPHDQWRVYAAYSDDGGETWKRGQTAADDLRAPGARGHANEVQMVELADGTVMLNARSEGGSRHRKIATSRDGGLSWSPLEDDRSLIEPQCMGSLLRDSDPLDGQPSRLLFSNPATPRERAHGTIRLSFDEGKTWPVAREFYAGSFAYSCLAVLPDGTIGCLFERDQYGKITWARFSLAWLAGGHSEPAPMPQP